MRKIRLFCLILFGLCLSFAAFSACSTGGDSGNIPKPDIPTNSESYRESNIPGDDKESESISESGSESGEESVHTHKFERNADERYLKSAATCEKRAEYYFSCECGEMGVQTFEYGNLLPHTEVIDEGVEATCTKAGLSAGKHCSVCNKVLEAQIAIPALGHDLAMHEGKASTCSEKGYADYETCRRCDYTTYRELPLAEHELENGICKNCGKEITPHTHIEVIDEGKPATCLESGLTNGKHCSVCNKILEEQQVIPALGHDIISHDGNAATCAEAGYEAYETCSRCDYTTYIAIPALGHDYVPHNGKEATCTEAGYKTYMTCTRCDYTTYEVIPALGHNLTHYNGKAATCIEAGYEAYDECSRCGYTTYKEIPAFGHSFTNYISDGNATCTTDGTKTAKCDNCNITDTVLDIGSAPGHSVGEWIVEIAPTKTQTGLKSRYCTRCDEKLEEAVIEETGSLGLAYEINTDGTTCTITGLGECSDDIIYIPKHIDGYKVTKIGYRAFKDCIATSIIISETVSTIEAQAFYSCINLTDFTLPETIGYIGTQIFIGCSSLETVYYNTYATSGEETSILQISSIKTVIFGDNLTSLSDYACYNCSNLTKVILSKNTRSIGAYAFYNCTKLKEIDLPDALTSIGFYSFWCSGLYHLTIPDNVNSLNDSFRDCKVTDIVIPTKLISFPRQSFYGCRIKNVFYRGNELEWNSISMDEANASSFKNATIYFYSETEPTESGNFWHYENGIISIWNGKKIEYKDGFKLETQNDETTLVKYFGNDKEVVIPKYIVNIGKNAFSDYSDITDITISNGISSIEENAFKNCSKLTKINFNGTMAQWKVISKGASWNSNTGDYIVYCTDGKLDKSDNEID